MTAQEKIKEAEYFLTRLPKIRIENMKYETSAFLTAARSVLDHLLEDYRIKFSLGEIKILRAKDFRKKAMRKKNRLALDFIKWYQNRMRLLRQNEKYGFLYDLRNINVHVRVPPQSIQIQGEGQLNPKSVIEIPILFPPVGIPVMVEVDCKNKDSGEISPKWKISTTAFFNERPDEDLISLCRGFFSEIQGIVNEAENKWK